MCKKCPWLKSGWVEDGSWLRYQPKHLDQLKESELANEPITKFYHVVCDIGATMPSKHHNFTGQPLGVMLGLLVPPRSVRVKDKLLCFG